MGLSKRELWTHVKTTLQEANKDLKKNPVKVDYQEDLLLLLPMRLFREAQWWLRDLPELAAIRKLRGYAKPEFWDALEADEDCEDLYEVQLLRQAQQALAKAFRSPERPLLFKKSLMQKEIKSVTPK